MKEGNMSEQLRWGFLSASSIAHVVATDFQLAGIKIQAVGAREIAKANEFADKFGIPNRHEGYESLVADPEVDIVYISTLQSLHAEHALLAIRAGKHVLLEKPFTLNAAESQEIRAAAESAGVFVMEAMWTRFLPMMTEVFRIIESGQIGEVRLSVADHSLYLPEHLTPRLWRPEAGGGALLDLGIYPVSFFARLFGRENLVTARATLTKDGVDLTTSAIFEYQDGAQALMTTSMETSGSVNASIIGTKGRIEIERMFYEQTTFTVHENDLTSAPGTPSLVSSYEAKIEGRGMQYQALEVERCIRAGLTESPIMTLDETVSIMETMDEIRKQTGVKYPGE
jgi:predicted dehydrogenase